jgi:hypothetical protein
MLPLRLLHETPDLTVAGYGPLCLGRWRVVPDSEAMRALRDAMDAWATQSAPFVAINIIDFRALTDVSSDVRAEIARVQEHFSGRQIGLATVIVERGFYAAAVRAVAGAVQAISRAPFPQRVFADVPLAAQWARTLAPHDARFSLADDDVVAACDLLAAPQARPVARFG